MKTNFKKLALVAGVSAALAAGSMSAHAVIQAVPAPAVLIPLFSTGEAGGASGPKMTVRVHVANSVGVDAIVQLFAPATGGGESQSEVQKGLSQSAPNASTPSASKLHWYFMSSTSNEIQNSAFPVSANDVSEFTSNNMPTSTANPAASCSIDSTGTATKCGASGIDLSLSSPNTNGYLIIVNESANLGGAPNIAFTADAFMALDSEGSMEPKEPKIPSSIFNFDWKLRIWPGESIADSGKHYKRMLINNIPVIPLSDAADGDDEAPSLANNVLEMFGNVPAGSPYANPVTGVLDGPVVSPMISGIRIGFGKEGKVADTYRVIDFPINGGNASFGETFVVWSDRNESLNILGSAIAPVPAITGNIFQFDCDETQRSAGSLTITRQLTFVNAYDDFYTNPYQKLQKQDYGPEEKIFPTVRDIKLSNGITEEKCSSGKYQIAGTAIDGNLNQGGFFRWFAEPNPYNVGQLKAGTFQSGIIFRLKRDNLDGYGQFPTDNGSFLGL